MAAQRTPDAFSLILSDLNMPVLRGDDATRELRASGVKVPIIGISANIEAAQQECLQSGMDAFVGKPVGRDALRQILHRHVPVRKSSF